MAKRSFGKEVIKFITQIDAYESTLPLVMRSLATEMNRATASFDTFLKAEARVITRLEHHDQVAEIDESQEIETSVSDDETIDDFLLDVPLRGRRKADENGLAQEDDIVRYTLDGKHVGRIQKFRKDAHNLMIAVDILPKSALVALVSQFDAYLGRLIRLILIVRPELLNASEKSMPFAELIRFPDMNSAREYILEKEVESVLRLSHVEQFAWLENKLSMPLREGLESWSAFVEITERRNLIVHTDSIVSSQYLAVCKRHNVPLHKNCTTGTQLAVTARYYRTAVEHIYEIGVKLAQVIWRKILPKQLDQAEKNLQHVTYALLEQERYTLARILLEFATITLKKHASEEYRLMHIVNLAIAYKWTGESERASKVLRKIDWSATGDRFKLPVAVLNDDREKVFWLMDRIGSNGEVPQMAYKSWPVFRGLREDREFLSTYERIFHEPYEVVHMGELLNWHSEDDEEHDDEDSAETNTF